MDEKKPRRRRWLWIVGGIIFGPPLLIALILILMIQTHGLRADQIQAPAQLMSVKPEAVTQSAPGSKPLTFADYFEKADGKDAAAIYRKYESTFLDKMWREKNVVLNRKAGDPLTGDQVRWLIENREMVDDLLRMASLSTKPFMTYEQAAGRKMSDQLPLPNYLGLQDSVRILTAEARRRRDAGDLNGAADALLSVQPMAQATREPVLISHLVALQMQTMANKELGAWISEGNVPPDIARRIQDQLSKQAIGLPDFRKAAEIEYAGMRNDFVYMLNNPIGDTIRREFGKRNPEDKSASLGALFWRHPVEFVAGGAMLVGAKANASTIVDRYDALYTGMFESIDKNTRFERNEQEMKILNVPYSPKFNVWNVDEARTRTNTNAAFLRLDLAGLNVASGAAVGEKDPFNNDPLKTVSEGGATMIYSVGPDLKDDRGALTYDATNGTFSAGDIFLRVRRR